MGKNSASFQITLFPLVALIIGFFIGIQLRAPIDGMFLGYLGLAVIGGIDTVFGGIRSSLEGKYAPDIFLTGFVGNTLMGCALAWVGDKISLNLFLVVAFVFGWRIFTNLSLIRRILLTKWHENRHRKRLEAERQAHGVGGAS